MIHDPRCPVYNVPEWEDCTECGPCDYFAELSDPSASI